MLILLRHERRYFVIKLQEFFSLCFFSRYCAIDFRLTCVHKVVWILPTNDCKLPFQFFYNWICILLKCSYKTSCPLLRFLLIHLIIIPQFFFDESNELIWFLLRNWPSSLRSLWIFVAVITKLLLVIGYSSKLPPEFSNNSFP